MFNSDGSLPELVIPRLERNQSIRRDRFLHLLHAVQEIVHVNLPQLDRVQRLHLVHLEFSNRTVGRVPGETGQVGSGEAGGELGDLVDLVYGEVVVLLLQQLQQYLHSVAFVWELDVNTLGEPPQNSIIQILLKSPFIIKLLEGNN